MPPNPLFVQVWCPAYERCGVASWTRTLSNERIVVIGGGTGAYAALIGLKRHSQRISAVITMADDGGSSGLLRDQFGHLPPGDTRRALLALTPTKRANALLRSLFEYRFNRGQGLNGHSVGNLLLTALAEIHGDMESAVREAAQLLRIRGEVLPVTRDDVRLVAELEDGTIIWGEHNIDVRTVRPEVRIQRVFLSPEAGVSESARQAIESADILVLGPGDLFTSIIPNLLVRGVPEAVRACGGTRIFLCNLMTKHGETDGFRASDFLREVLHYIGRGDALDYFLVNETALRRTVAARYAAERAQQVEVDVDVCNGLGATVVNGDLLARGPLVRHDPGKLARHVLETHRRHIREASMSQESRRLEAVPSARSPLLGEG